MAQPIDHAFVNIATHCFNKLTKIERLYIDIATKLETNKSNRSELWSDMCSKPGALLHKHHTRLTTASTCSRPTGTPVADPSHGHARLQLRYRWGHLVTGD